jgi:hypothetical protein
MHERLGYCYSWRDFRDLRQKLSGDAVHLKPFHVSETGRT